MGRKGRDGERNGSEIARNGMDGERSTSDWEREVVNGARNESDETRREEEVERVSGAPVFRNSSEV
ncbi:MAG TPA: hypothetical protein VHD63_11105, partial [Ktedonobacteraceae bacterium]|nr:hypothetical protein [Ktedonobacteraceae bacterium]